MRIFLGIGLSLLTVGAAFADEALVTAAQDRLKQRVSYNGAYMKLDYPGGDVPAHIGVCTDVIIRSYRAAYGFDFQEAVHEDMKANFSAYPKIWGLTRTDRNIDHRRVPNLETYLKRQGADVGISKKASDFKPGDVVSWRLAGSLPHIGIVSDRKARDGTPLIIHNVGAGPKEEDVLFAYKMNGHFRFVPDAAAQD
ncbi:DUF1287 domain-containing protein [Hellea sp.]|nr:DUF1287 domain-containing protein [Hellea sp.]